MRQSDALVEHSEGILKQDWYFRYFKTGILKQSLKQITYYFTKTCQEANFLVAKLS